MARPLSEEKREAILAAATNLVAELGIGASTAKIAQAAGVAEGTLFTYFATKDELLNHLLLEIQTELAQAMLASCSMGGDARKRLQRIWNCLVEWGVANPVKRRALHQLKVSDRITAESRSRCNALFHEAREVVEQSMSEHIEAQRASFYIDTVLMGLADITIEAISTSPDQHEHFKQAGFDLFWKGATT
ncbi:TetR/AcrR family transcriptional regulator [Ralstonia pseudosolanacearum]|uniref:TetR/AcrR family transcriptional regulator n=1 Tax=Ralstonia pseudosolanacearum TaxID=1310165 RepID=UPI0026751D6E|nr:TetR/AcrR family transcriptional regulator [Ralstonia pseudosolanacearum]MDO3526390.1 TetR/AcrR family transcriptional regulator [Ralstonia pseudosolanacearum]